MLKIWFNHHLTVAVQVYIKYVEGLNVWDQTIKVESIRVNANNLQIY